MAALFVTNTYTKDFEINISKLEDCNGIYKLEVFVPRTSVPLVIKDGSGQIIREDYSSFVLESPVPITNGILRFEFKEDNNLSIGNAPKSATVRYLYCE